MASARAESEFFSQGERRLTYCGYDLAIPSEHALPRTLDREPFREQLLAAAATVLLRGGSVHYVDVGANIGDTAAVVSRAATGDLRMTLIEPSDFFGRFLKRNAQHFGQSEVLLKYVGITSPLTPIRGALQYWGGTAFVNAALEREIPPSEQVELLSIIVPTTRLVKVDCDGLDVRILMTTVSTMLKEASRERPAFLFELEFSGLDSWKEAVELLEALMEAGYSHVVSALSSGVLLYGGPVDTRFRDLLCAQAQGALDNSWLKFSTDLLLLDASHGEVWEEVTQLLRNWQDPLRPTVEAPGKPDEPGV